ncbi:MAG: hypothetical protein L0Z50_13505 [Verrucomicrobiales bacterium]|nr:hypothetical protein [Verrucomicrobiales bacterium]
MTFLTLELVADTAGSVKHLADTWGVSAQGGPPCGQIGAAVPDAGPIDRVEAFQEFQRLLQLTPEKAAA